MHPVEFPNCSSWLVAISHIRTTSKHLSLQKSRQLNIFFWGPQLGVSVAVSWFLLFGFRLVGHPRPHIREEGWKLRSWILLGNGSYGILALNIWSLQTCHTILVAAMSIFFLGTSSTTKYHFFIAWTDPWSPWMQQMSCLLLVPVANEVCNCSSDTSVQFWKIWVKFPMARSPLNALLQCFHGCHFFLLSANLFLVLFSWHSNGRENLQFILQVRVCTTGNFRSTFG